MDDDWQPLGRAMLAAVLTGPVVGVVLAGVASTSPAAWSRTTLVVPLGSAGIMAMCGLGLGTAVGWVAEQMAGFCGEVLLIPVTVAALVAGGVAYAGFTWVNAGSPGSTAILLLAIGVLTFWAGGAARVVRERLR